MKIEFKEIYKEIKKYNTIVIARHVGPDPDALSSQFALKKTIEITFSNKKVYAVGVMPAKFKFLGIPNKETDEIYDNALLIVVDTPDIKRIDGVDITKFKSIIKIDHHPMVDDFSNITLIDTESCSAAQLILELIFNTKLKLNDDIARLLYIGIVSDSERFLLYYTTPKTMHLVSKLLNAYPINFTSVYEKLYLKPLSEIRFQGYIYQNFIVTENGLGYIKLTEALINEFKVDAGSAGNMVNSLNFIDEVLVWAFFSDDIKNNNIRVSIRSKGPEINEVATRYNGGGHKLASGAKVENWEQVDSLINDLDVICNKYIQSLKYETENIG